MLFHALRSRYIDPGRPPAAAGGLRSQYPDLVLGPRQPLDCRHQLRQAVLEENRPPLPFEPSTRGRRTKEAFPSTWQSLGYQVGPPEPLLTTSGRATYTKWLMSTHQTECHDVFPGKGLGLGRQITTQNPVSARTFPSAP